jgi:hypothetical protein
MKKLFALILALSMALALVPAAFGEGTIVDVKITDPSGRN